MTNGSSNSHSFFSFIWSSLTCFGILCLVAMFPKGVKATPSDRNSSTEKPLACPTIEVSSRRRKYSGLGPAGDISTTDLLTRHEELRAQTGNKDAHQELMDRLNRRHEELQAPTGNKDVDQEITDLLSRHRELQAQIVNKDVDAATLLEMMDILNRLEELRAQR